MRGRVVWRFIPVLCATLLVAAPVVAQPAGRSYELRTYTAAPGRLDELHARFRQHSIPLLQRHGAEVVGTWVPKPNPGNAVVILLAYPSPVARQSVWTRIVADPQWTAMKRRTDGRGLLVEEIAELPLAATQALQARSGIGDLELRTHATPEPAAGAIAAFVPTKPTAGMAVLSLHPRRIDDLPRLQRSLVMLVSDLPTDAGQITVLTPTDYSPFK